MTPDDVVFSLSFPTLAGFVLVVVIPTVIWCLQITKMMKELLEMHRNPNTSNATSAISELIQELHRSAAELHSNNTRVIEENTRAIRELSHFVQWLANETHGKPPPPYMEGGRRAVDQGL